MAKDKSRLLDEMSRWTNAYSHGTLISFDFVKHLKLREEVQQICTEKGWEFTETEGNLGLLEKLLEGNWPEADFLVVPPGQKVIATNDDRVIGAS